MQDISIFYLFRLAWKRLWVLMLAFVFFTFGALAYCKMVAVPIYSAKASIIVTNGAIVAQYDEDEDQKQVNGTDISASRGLIATVEGLLSSQNMYIEMAQKLGGNYTYTKLKSMSTVKSRDDSTLFIDVTFNSTSGTEAENLANKFAEIATEYVPEQIPYSKVKVVENALSYGKIFPKTILISGVSGVIGILLAFAVVFILDFSNQSIRGEEEFVDKYDIPLLGSVPDFENAAAKSLTNYYSKGGYYGVGK